MNTYKAIIDNEEFSKITAMKKILGYSDADIEENFKNLIKEKCLTELGEYWSGKMTEAGPAGIWDVPPIPIKGISDKDDDASGDEEGREDTSGEEGSDEGGEEAAEASDKGGGEEPEEPEKKEAPEPTFGLS